MTCRIFFPDQGSNPLLPTVKAHKSTTGPPGIPCSRTVEWSSYSLPVTLIISSTQGSTGTCGYYTVLGCLCVCVCDYYDVFCVCTYGYYIGHTFGLWTQFQPTDAGDTSGYPAIQPNSDSINLEIVPYSMGYRGSVLRLCDQTQVQLLKDPILRDMCWVKAKIALLGKLTILGRSWTHVPKNQIPIADQRARDFKELDVHQQMNG